MMIKFDTIVLQLFDYPIEAGKHKIITLPSLIADFNNMPHHRV